ncbi:hypothetical protein RHS03_00703, partial [Rhizoctonia solani]
MPICERCSQGGYECFGYDHNNPSGSSWRKPLYSDSHGAKPFDSISDVSLSNSGREVENGLVEAQSSVVSATSAQTKKLIIQMLQLIRLSTNKDSFENSDNYSPINLQPMGSTRTPISLAHLGGDASIYDTFPPTRPKTHTSGSDFDSPLSIVDTGVLHHIFYTNQLSVPLAHIPRSLPSPSDIQEAIKYVRLHIERMLGITYFKPPQAHIDTFLRKILSRIWTCNFARKARLLDAKVTLSIFQGSDNLYYHNLANSIKQFEQEVQARLNESLTSYEIQERLTDLLEMLFLKGAIHDAPTTYRIFCHMAPSFFKMVYSDRTLQPAQNSSFLASVAHVLASSRHGTAHFMLMDIMGSMIYGLPQLAAYDTNTELFHAEPHPVEWINCFPGEFQILLAKINACRDQEEAGKGWQSVEQRLLSWTPRPQFQPQGLESWKSVTWLAVQETWRQTLLMYLYLAVCGVPTDDPRIQSALRQLFQLMRVIRRQDPPVANVHFFAQCLIAGICSLTEIRRKLVRERLSCAAETRFWMFRGPEIVPVLEHLWLGAALGGGAVTWNDYIYSRCTVLPL